MAFGLSLFFFFLQVAGAACANFLQCTHNSLIFFLELGLQLAYDQGERALCPLF